MASAPLELGSISASIRALGRWTRTHMIRTAIAVLVIAALAWWGWGALHPSVAEAEYVLGTVAKGTVVATVSASGQVASVDSVNITPKASGELTWVGVQEGDTVRAGQAIASIDDADAKKQIADAEQSLAQAKLAYEKDQAQAPLDYQGAQQSVSNAQSSLASTYTDTLNALASAYLSLPAVVSDAHDALYGYSLSPKKTQWNVDTLKAYFIPFAADSRDIGSFAEKAEQEYAAAKPKYDASLAAYKQLTYYSATSSIEQNLDASIDMATAVAQSLSSTVNFIDEAEQDADTEGVTLDSAVATLRTTAQGDLTTANSVLGSLEKERSAITAAKQALASAQNSFAIAQIGNNASGTNPISLQSEAYSIAGQEQDLATLKDDLADYTVTAPFAGTIASLDSHAGDTVSTGTTIATLISRQQVAQLSLNEVDAAKVKAGDKATLTFDALPDTTMTGTVASIDPVGTVTQGVVSYDITITFDTQNDAVKPGMTVNADIETAVAQDALIVPSAAVTTAGGTSYVMVVNGADGAADGSTIPAAGAQIERVPVTTGISDATEVAITDGLTDGQRIVAGTRGASASPSSGAAVRAGGAGGGANRAFGGGFGGAGTIRIGG
ncbi:MAG TPA: efflux RND transporter periplasmic adaptor subunit [Candidatus Paceibacterota bacterium]|nr:efflux RND transporter periplasmic adaptor subunit [Candidatus Paceibacterota bacterium]